MRNDKEKIETNLCELIFKDEVVCSIDRPLELVEFKLKKSQTETIDDWVTNVNQIVDLVDFVCERIEREDVKSRS